MAPGRLDANDVDARNPIRTISLGSQWRCSVATCPAESGSVRSVREKAVRDRCLSWRLVSRSILGCLKHTGGDGYAHAYQDEAAD